MRKRRTGGSRSRRLGAPNARIGLLVARAGQTTKPALRRACDLLLQVNARVMGIVLNAFDLHSVHGYSYYGGRYSNYYYHEESSEEKPTAASKVS